MALRSMASGILLARRWRGACAVLTDRKGEYNPSERLAQRDDLLASG